MIAISVLKRSLRYFSAAKCCKLNMNETLKEIFYASVNAVKPCQLIGKNEFVKFHKSKSCEFLEIGIGTNLKKYNVTDKKIQVIGFGKGVLAITAVLESVLDGKLSGGILSVPVGTCLTQSLKDSTHIKVIEGAAGNLPDQAAVDAATEIRDKVQSLTSDDFLLVVITGGGSALLPLPIDSITLDEKTSLIKRLSKAGATINELNTVRIAISQLKGGKLLELGLKAHRIVSLIVSDIIGDPLDLIASGPTIQFAAPRTSPAKVLEKYNLVSSTPDSVAQAIQKNENNHKTSTVNSDVFLIGNNRLAIEAAMEKASSFGFSPVFLSAEVEGDVAVVSRAFFELGTAAREFGTDSREDFKARLAGVAKVLSAQPNFIDDLVSALGCNSKPICIVSGGECTVTVTGDGLGGRNQELALRFSKLCRDATVNDLLLLSAGTDGIDGNNTAAGAIGGSQIGGPLITTTMMQDFINRNDSFNFYQCFDAGYQITVGHTGTNVMDVTLLMVRSGVDLMAKLP